MRFFVQTVDVEGHAVLQQRVQGVFLADELFQHRVFYVAFDVTYGELGTWINTIGDGGFLAFYCLIELDVCMHVSFVVQHLSQVLDGAFGLTLVINHGVLSDFAEQTCSPVGGVNSSETVDLEGNLRSGFS